MKYQTKKVSKDHYFSIDNDLEEINLKTKNLGKESKRPSKKIPYESVLGKRSNMNIKISNANHEKDTLSIYQFDKLKYENAISVSNISNRDLDYFLSIKEKNEEDPNESQLEKNIENLSKESKKEEKNIMMLIKIKMKSKRCFKKSSLNIFFQKIANFTAKEMNRLGECNVKLIINKDSDTLSFSNPKRLKNKTENLDTEQKTFIGVKYL